MMMKPYEQLFIRACKENRSEDYFTRLYGKLFCNQTSCHLSQIKEVNKILAKIEGKYVKSFTSDFLRVKGNQIKGAVNSYDTFLTDWDFEALKVLIATKPSIRIEGYTVPKRHRKKP